MDPVSFIGLDPVVFSKVRPDNHILKWNLATGEKTYANNTMPVYEIGDQSLCTRQLDCNVWTSPLVRSN